MIVHRISSSKYIRDLSGYGAWKFGGRWNSPSRFVLYTSESLALAAWEVFVNVEVKLLPLDLSHATISIPDEISVKEILLENLPPGWTEQSAIPQLRKMGDVWLDALESLVLKVPSAVTRTEFNFLLNPKHPGFTRVEIVKVEPFEFDPRAIRKIT